MKNNLRTYLQGDVSQKQKDHFQAHMDSLGFASTSVPGEFENTQESLRMNMVFAGKDILDRSSQLPMHSHTFMEIFQYVSDTKVEYLIGTQRYILQQGDIVCIPPGICHQVLHYEPADAPCIRYLISAKPAFLKAIGWTFEPGEYFLLRAEGARRQQLMDLCRMAVEESQEKGLQWRTALHGYVQVLLTQILRNADSSIKAEKAGLFEQLLAYVDTHLDQKITLIDTAQNFYISDRTVNREFRKNLGISFYRYVTQRRLLMAQNLIFRDLPLEDVCRRCGFADYPTFYRAFRKEYGMSPRQMRQSD